MELKKFYIKLEAMTDLFKESIYFFNRRGLKPLAGFLIL
jgi:hypothetical protein